MPRPIPSHLHIAVGSTSAPKVQCVRSGIARWQQLPRFADVSVEITGHATASGVPDQPIGHEQTAQGAINRARSLRASGVVADYYVGIEGGVTRLDVGSEAFFHNIGYVYIWDGKRGFLAPVGSVPLPPQAVHSVFVQGQPLAATGDMLAGSTDTNHREGFGGIITEGLVVRADLPLYAFIHAFMPFWQPWYGAGE